MHFDRRRAILLRLSRFQPMREVAAAVVAHAANLCGQHLAHALDLSADISEAAGDMAGARAARDEAMGLRTTLNIPAAGPASAEKAGV